MEILPNITFYSCNFSCKIFKLGPGWFSIHIYHLVTYINIQVLLWSKKFFFFFFFWWINQNFWMMRQFWHGFGLFLVKLFPFSETFFRWKRSFIKHETLKSLLKNNQSLLLILDTVRIFEEELSKRVSPPLGIYYSNKRLFLGF